MAKIFRPSTRESTILSKIESSKEYARRKAIANVRDCDEMLSNAIAMKLIESNLVETTSKDVLEEEIIKCLGRLTRAEDFDVDYQVAPFRQITNNPNIVTLFVTALVIEKVINQKETIDIYGADDEIYRCINKQVQRYLPH